MNPKSVRWIKSLCAVLMGFALYYYLMPSLPPVARHKPSELDFGIVVAAWFCVCMYGLIETGAAISRWLRSRR